MSDKHKNKHGAFDAVFEARIFLVGDRNVLCCWLCGEQIKSKTFVLELSGDRHSLICQWCKKHEFADL